MMFDFSIDTLIQMVIWWAPIFLMWLWFYRESMLGFVKFLPVLVALLMVDAGVIVASVYPPTQGFFIKNGWVTLFLLYGTLASAFALYLRTRGWPPIRAIAIGGLSIYVGSYYWEVPYILRNAFITGYENDWWFHAWGLVYMLFIAFTVGWRREWWLLLLGWVVSIAVMTLVPVAPMGGSTQIWNSPPYLANRIICTLITFALVKKELKKC